MQKIQGKGGGGGVPECNMLDLRNSITTLVVMFQ